MKTQHFQVLVDASMKSPGPVYLAKLTWTEGERLKTENLTCLPSTKVPNLKLGQGIVGS